MKFFWFIDGWILQFLIGNEDLFFTFYVQVFAGNMELVVLRRSRKVRGSKNPDLSRYVLLGLASSVMEVDRSSFLKEKRKKKIPDSIS